MQFHRGRNDLGDVSPDLVALGLHGRQPQARGAAGTIAQQGIDRL